MNGDDSRLRSHEDPHDPSADADEGPVWLPWSLRLAGPTGLRYRILCYVFAFATLSRLLLPDTLRLSAMPITLVHLIGAILIATTRSWLGWLLCALAGTSSLLFVGDQLTQSLLLVSWALCALVCWAGSKEGRAHRLENDLPASVGALTIGTYAIASFHKLNADFFDPSVSCAAEGLRTLAVQWSAPFLDGWSVWPGWPLAFIALELLVALLWLVRPQRALILAVALHIPLTVAFAPSFVFIMMTGWTALFSEAEMRHLLGVARTRRLAILLGGGIASAVSLALHPSSRCWSINFDWCIRESLLWVVAAWALFAALTWPARQIPRTSIPWKSAWVCGLAPCGSSSDEESMPSIGDESRDDPQGCEAAKPGDFPRDGGSRGRQGSGPSREGSRVSRRGSILVAAASALWLINGLLPYTGLKFQHSAAMLSNLRVDEGCWNSLIVPEELRLQDRYLRIEEANFHSDPDRDPQPEAQARLNLRVPKILWNIDMLWYARRYWCHNPERQISLVGSYAGQAFVIDDFCGEQGWPFEGPWLPGYRAFQKNLRRECPQRCVH